MQPEPLSVSGGSLHPDRQPGGGLRFRQLPGVALSGSIDWVASSFQKSVLSQCWRLDSQGQGATEASLALQTAAPGHPCVPSVPQTPLHSIPAHPSDFLLA